MSDCHISVAIKVWVKSLVSGARYEVLRDTMDVALENHVKLRPSQPFIVGEKSLFTIEATTDQNNTKASAKFSGIEERLT